MSIEILLQGIVGSTAYGLAGPGSDIDQLGIFARPTIELVGLVTPEDSIVKTSPDVTLHEAGKYVKLALNCNPTAIELMWLPPRLIKTSSPLGQELVEIRAAFLSAPRVRNAYLGYATQQFRRLEQRGDGTFSSDTRHRTAKHARHLLRLLVQGLWLYRTGELQIQLYDDVIAEVRQFGEEIAAGDVERARQALANYEEAFDFFQTKLPEVPNVATVADWLRRVRKANW